MATVSRFFQEPEGSFFLFGPRGTGKSTWLGQRFPEALWLDLLDPSLARRLLANPSLLREMLEARPQTRDVVIDEVQRIPELLTLVHQLIEERRARFALTGSSARKLKRSGVDLLAGRAGLRAMHPFLAAELGSEFELARALQFGMLPLVWSAPEPRETLRGYVGLYLREEVQQEGLVRRIDHFSRFLEAISFSHGATLNLSEVARECQVSRKTVEGYLEILEDLMLAFRLPVFSKRAQRQLVAHPKFYLFDAGIFQSLRPRGLLDSPSEVGGQALEGLIAQHLRAWIDLGGSRDALYYWRTRAGNEVDFVVYGDSGFWALEVKSGATVQPKDLSGLRAFGTDYPEASLVLLHGGRDRYVRDEVLCQPVDEFLRGLTPSQPIR